MAKNGRGAVEAGREGGGSAGVRPSKVGKLMGSNGETDKCTAGKTNNPIKKENPLALTAAWAAWQQQGLAFQILLGVTERLPARS